MAVGRSEAEQRVRVKHEGRIELVRYAGKVAAPSRFRCRECDHEWTTTVNRVGTVGTGCPECSRRKSAKRATLSEAEVRQRVQDKHEGRIELVRYAGKVVGRSDFHCRDCGHEWTGQVAPVIGQGTGCPECGRRRAGRAAALPEAEALRRVEDKHEGRIELVRYAGSTKGHSDFRCRDCDHEWVTSIHRVANEGSGCPRCNSRSLPEAEALRRVEDKHDGRIELVRYAGTADGRSDFRCRDCHGEWSTSAEKIMGQGTGCPECGRRRSDLARAVSEAELRERVLAKHEGRVELVRYGGSTKGHSGFRCRDCGNEWASSINAVASNGSGCPACARRRGAQLRAVSESEVLQRLLDRHEGRIELVAYAGEMNAHSGFRCRDCGHEWATSASAVTGNHGTGCPECRSTKLFEAEVRQRVKAKHEGRIELVRYAGSTKGHSDYRCRDCQHEWTTNTKSVLIGGSGCPMCARVNLTDAEARQRVWDYARFAPHPDVPYPGRNDDPWPGPCTGCGEVEVQPTLAGLKGGGRGFCPACARDATATARRRAEDEARRLAIEGGWTPDADAPYRSSNEPWPGTCNTCAAAIAPRLGNVLQGMGPCRYCAKNAPIDEEAARAEAIQSGYTPYAHIPYPGQNTPWPGTCNRCGQEVAPDPSAARGGHKACRPCTSRELADAALAAADSEARVEAQEFGFTPDPDIPYPGGNRPWPGTCNTCSRPTSPRLGNLRNRGGGPCKYCAGLATRTDEEARLIAAQSGYTPDPATPYPGRVGDPWPGTCNTCGNHVAPRLNSILSGGGACAHCARGGFDPFEPARTYLLYHLEMRAAKVGVTTAASDHRLNRFRRAGWQVYRLRHYVTGAEALAEERRILAEWRDAGYPEALTAEDMPMGGWTETAPLSALPGWELLLGELPQPGQHLSEPVVDAGPAPFEPHRPALLQA